MRSILNSLLINFCCFALSVFIFSACNKETSPSNPAVNTPVYTIKSESPIKNLETEIKSTEMISYLKSIRGLNLNEGISFSFNETDSLITYKFKYIEGDKILLMYHLRYTNKYKVINIEHTVDKADTNKEEVVIYDYSNTPILVESYENKKFVGFAEPLTPKNTPPRTTEYSAELADETWRQCVNRVYKKAKDNCADDAFCDTFCSVANGACEVTFLAGAVFACT